MNSNPAQIKKIHALKGALKLDDDVYRAMLAGYRGCTTSKDLLFEEAGVLIAFMEANAISAGVWQKRPAQDSGAINRPGYATSAQIAKIKAIWHDVSRQPDAESRKKALNTFLTKHFGISFIDWLPTEMVSKVIRTLEAMRAQREHRV
jgi:phage gp16-like protein